MTGRQPKTAVDMILFTGPSLKNSQRRQLSIQQLQKQIDGLDKSIGLLHEAARTQEDKQRRRRAQKESESRGAIRFNKGDYVVVSASCNQAHKHKLSKLSVNWHGPYEVVGLIPGAPSKLKVRLVGAPLNKIFTVNWRKVRRIAGPSLAITQAVQDCALHDQQEFVVADLMDWGFDDNNNVLIKVHWLGFEDSEDTWEPMAQLYEDVKHKVEKYVKRTIL